MSPNGRLRLRRCGGQLDRRNVLVEIDALVALMLGVSIDDLCTIYRTQFAVLYGYDHWEYTYDANGRLVPNSVLTVWRKKGDAITEDERKAVHPGSGVEYTYELPFGTLDREADMRTAYAEFERRLAAEDEGRLMAELLPTLMADDLRRGLVDYLDDDVRARGPGGRPGSEPSSSRTREDGIFKGPYVASPPPVPPGGRGLAVVPRLGPGPRPHTATRPRPTVG